MKGNIKAPRHWLLCGEFTGDRWIPRTNGQKRGKCFHLMTSSCATLGLDELNVLLLYFIFIVLFIFTLIVIYANTYVRLFIPLVVLKTTFTENKRHGLTWHSLGCHGSCGSYLTQHHLRIPYSLWRHQMGTFSALLVLCAGNSPFIGEFHTQRPVTRSFDVFFDLRLINSWVNNRATGDLRRYRAHYDVTVMVPHLENHQVPI